MSLSLSPFCVCVCVCVCECFCMPAAHVFLTITQCLYNRTFYTHPGQSTAQIEADLGKDKKRLWRVISTKTETVEGGDKMRERERERLCERVEKRNTWPNKRKCLTLCCDKNSSFSSLFQWFFRPNQHKTKKSRKEKSKNLLSAKISNPCTIWADKSTSKCIALYVNMDGI